MATNRNQFEKRERDRAKKAKAAAAKAKRIPTIRNLIIAGVVLVVLFFILSHA